MEDTTINMETQLSNATAGEVVALDDVNELAPVDYEENDDDLKKKSLAEMRDALDRWWVDLALVIDLYKEAMDKAMTEWYSGNMYEDYKTRIDAAKQLMNMWKTAHDIGKKDNIEVVFKPIFSKPPKMT